MKLILKITVLICLLVNVVQATTFDNKNKDSWLNLLSEKQYTVLDNELQKLYDAVQNDITAERDLLFAFSSFDNSAFEVEYLIEEWKNEKPKSLFAQTAWGIYNTNVGFLSRGTKFINKTSSVQISNMNTYFSEAKKSLTDVIKKDPKFTIPLSHLLYISMANGTHDESNRLITTALNDNPYSSIIRYNYLSLLQPKWGGSLEELKKFMDETRLLYDENILLKRQEGYYEYVLSDMLRHKPNFDKGMYLDYLNIAIEKNPTNGFLLTKRGNAYYYHLKDNLKALENYEEALKFSPQKSDIFEMISKIHLRNKDYKKALTFIDKALKYDGQDPALLRIKGKIYFKQRRMDDALYAYQDSLIYANENAIAHKYIGYIYYHKKNYALASESLLTSDSIKLGTAKVWYQITASQWHQKDCKFVESAYKYQSICNEYGKKCNQKNLSWAIRSAKHAKAEGICK